MKINSINSVNYSNNYYSENFLANISFEKRLPRNFYRPKFVKSTFAYRDFLKYSPIKLNFGKYSIPVHNEGIAQKLKSTYTSETFQTLFDFAKKKGTFDYTFNPETGHVKTSTINRKENVLMSDLIWTTDTCHNLTLVKNSNPEACTQVFNSLSKFYEKQQANFDFAIANPQKYKENDFWVSKVGVGHAFIPSLGKDHPWFTHTRLESVGMYLQSACDLILEGFNGAKYGYKNFKDIPQNVVNTIANSVKYLKAINYPTARSCGAWEEQTFVNSLTSDTAIINDSMRKILKLLYSPTENKDLILLRKSLLNSKHGDVFNDKKALEQLLKSGEKRIENSHYFESKRSNIPVPAWAEKCLGRKTDAAMAFIPQTEILNHKSPIKDAISKIGLLRRLERDLVRDNGAIRYQGDEYLNLGYHKIDTPWKNNKNQSEAQWFLVSEIAKGYGTVVKNMADNISKNGLTSKNKRLLDYALKKETEFINRSYARITPKNMTKSNRYSCPAYKIPEAYEPVATKSGIKFIPGAHTPLTWAESSLYEASNQFLENLATLEQLSSILS